MPGQTLRRFAGALKQRYSGGREARRQAIGERLAEWRRKRDPGDPTSSANMPHGMSKAIRETSRTTGERVPLPEKKSVMFQEKKKFAR